MASRGLGTSHLLGADSAHTDKVNDAVSSHADRRQPHQACTKTPESLYGIVRNRCTKTSGIGTSRGRHAPPSPSVDARLAAAPRLAIVDRPPAHRDRDEDRPR